MTLRFFMAIVGGALLGVGWLAALVDARRRMWHDMAAGTLVVRVEKG